MKRLVLAVGLTLATAARAEPPAAPPPANPPPTNPPAPRPDEPWYWNDQAPDIADVSGGKVWLAGNTLRFRREFGAPGWDVPAPAGRKASILARDESVYVAWWSETDGGVALWRLHGG